MDIVKGSIVKSKAGRDKDEFLVVVSVDNSYAYVCDGKHHKTESPKKKNLKHIAPTQTVIEMPQTNKQLRKLLNSFSTVDWEDSYVKAGCT